jgi:hypothetical protein
MKATLSLRDTRMQAAKADFRRDHGAASDGGRRTRDHAKAAREGDYELFQSVF